MYEPNVILASGSPRRSEILRNAGIEHHILIPDIDESPRPIESIQTYVVRLAQEKNLDVRARLDADAWVISADTMVELHGEWLGKPRSTYDAVSMLRRMANQTHTVWTGVTIYHTTSQREISFVDRTEVTFTDMSEAEIEHYVATGEPLDKAGSYGVQALGSRYVARLDGCFFNVMGLPISKVYKGLQDLGWSV